MHFLVDECTGPAVAQWLRGQSHEVFSVYGDARGMDDDDIIHKAFTENWILVTNDKDYGERKSFENAALITASFSCGWKTSAPPSKSRRSGNCSQIMPTSL